MFNILNILYILNTILVVDDTVALLRRCCYSSRIQCVLNVSFFHQLCHVTPLIDTINIFPGDSSVLLRSFLCLLDSSSLSVMVAVNSLAVYAVRQLYYIYLLFFICVKYILNL